MSTRTQKTIGILTSGGDCPGLNAAIRGVCKTAILEYGMKVVGISSGFRGLIESEYHELTEKDLSGILPQGGTILGTSREKPFKKDENDQISGKPKIIAENYHAMGLDCLVCIGGNGTMKTAYKLSKEGLNVIGIPKTIDNDVWGTDLSFGFDSAVSIATEAIDRIHTTANSHRRVMIVEVMGHKTGWLALYAGVAGGGDVILLPEIPYDEDVVAKYLLRRAEEGKPYSIVVVAEGVQAQQGREGKKKSAGQYLSRRLAELTGLEMRETILGYIQRGGTPTPMDRIIATRLGSRAAELMHHEKFGHMSAIRNNALTEIPLEDVAGKTRDLPPSHPLILEARKIGTCFGDRI
jgi:6-phosphofructokinase 1